MGKVKKFSVVFLGLLALLFVVGFLTAKKAHFAEHVNSAQDPTDKALVRYSMYPCIAKAVHTDFGKADVVALGNSAMKRAFNTRQFKDRLGLPIEVLDISKNYRGAELNYAILEEYLERHTPDLVVLEVNQGAGGKRRYHPNSYRLLKKRDLKDLIENDSIYDTDAQRTEVMKDLLAKRQENFQELSESNGAFSEDSLENESYPEKDCTPIREKYKEEKLAKRWAEIEPDFWRQHFSWDVEETSRANDLADQYNAKLAALLMAKDIPGVFVFVNRMGQGSLAPDFVDFLESRYGLPVYSAPAAVVLEIHDNRGFRDPTHMALPGSEIFIDFLIAELERDGFLDVFK